ncbi:hypothetical protein Van01_13190 [Micromonospora andamanensis]|uniref:Transposase n=1 Tax=Micromonospora andamanensis TaxID=1287068 RepID=A0ABQ4HR25_9ACTN|nr:hypothetical protein Van01_13190 [Micromonospora andamanensis]
MPAPTPGQPQQDTERPDPAQSRQDRRASGRVRSAPRPIARTWERARVYFQPTPEQDWQLVDTFSPVMHTGCGTNRPATRKNLPGSPPTEGRQ